MEDPVRTKHENTRIRKKFKRNTYRRHTTLPQINNGKHQSRTCPLFERIEQWRNITTYNARQCRESITAYRLNQDDFLYPAALDA